VTRKINELMSFGPKKISKQ